MGTPIVSTSHRESQIDARGVLTSIGCHNFGDDLYMMGKVSTNASVNQLFKAKNIDQLQFILLPEEMIRKWDHYKLAASIPTTRKNNNKTKIVIHVGAFNSTALFVSSHFRNVK